MDVLVARQPILDQHLHTYAYELLYRNEEMHEGKPIDGDQATADVLSASFVNIGLETLTNNKCFFINFTERLLLSDVPLLFPTDRLVIEILEDVPVSQAIIERLQYLKGLGYTLAMDDVTAAMIDHPFLSYVDIIKIDFLLTTEAERKEMAAKLLNVKKTLLAEKVESKERFEEAITLGCTYFQGFFFSKPDIVSAADLPIHSLSYVHLLQAVNEQDPDMTKISQHIEADVSLTYKLFKLMNSSAFITRGKVDSVHQAVVMLGIKELQKWLSILALQGLRPHHPDEVMTLSLVRAKFAEQLAVRAGFQTESSQLFIVGMFSIMERLLNQPMDEIVDTLLLPEETKAVLLGEVNRYFPIYQLFHKHEEGDWEKVNVYQHQLGLTKEDVTDSYHEAVEWTNQLDAQRLL
ncbi:EAL and HDOD domain-containing protein [Salsuginibacillus kocurii]|uniref:EAL and HDOD domain-containing protein n=1 Tax=Salsuginibacillus kocurii TaxID=427078 RepID=UPI00035D3D4E|nr:HDOD domain-containing protein [Salsuginibacillus kocurii]